MIKWLKRGLILLLITWGIFCALLWLLLGQLFDGGSRPLNQQTHYAQILKHPAAFGVEIAQFDCVNAHLHCLAISPMPGASPDANYGKPIREQLYKQGVVLPNYGNTVGIIVMLHGKGGRSVEMLPASMRYVASGFTVILLDLPGHGENTSPLLWATGQNDGNIASSALDDYRHITHRHHDPAFLWGISMGGAYANRTAQQHNDAFRGMILLSTYDRFEHVLMNYVRNFPHSVQQIVMWHAKTIAHFRRLNIEQSTPAEWAKQIDMPILQIHGDHDSLIPIALGKRLFSQYQSDDKQWITVTSAGHNNVLLTPQPIYADTIMWLYRHL